MVQFLKSGNEKFKPQVLMCALKQLSRGSVFYLNASMHLFMFDQLDAVWVFSALLVSAVF